MLTSRIRNSLKTRITLVTLLIFVVGMWSLAIYATRTLREDLQNIIAAQQFSTVSIFAAEINENLTERMHALEQIAGADMPALVKTPVALQESLQRRVVLNSLFNAGVYVTDADGLAIASMPVSAGQVGVNYLEREYVAAVLKDGKASISKPVVGKVLRSPVVALAVPIRSRQDHVIGALVGVIDLSMPSFLDRVSNHAYGKSGGYVLADQRHRIIVTATDKTRVLQLFPAPGVNPLFDRYLAGFEGSGTVVDTRGLEVLSSAKQIPIAGWLLVARVPTAEVFAPIQAVEQRMVVAAALLTIAAGCLIWLALRRQLAPLGEAASTLTLLARSKQTPGPLATTSRDEIGDLIGAFNSLLRTLREHEEALRRSETRYRQLFDNSVDGVLLTAPDGRILEANRAVCAMLQRTADELRQAGRAGIVDQTDPRLAGAIEERDRSGRFAGELTLLRKDGTKLPVDVSTAVYVDEDGNDRTSMFVRDISARKAAESVLAETQSRLLAVFAASPIGIVVSRLNDGKILDCNDAALRLYGFTRDEAIGRTVAELNTYADPAQRSLLVQQLMERGAVDRFPINFRTRHGTVGTMEASGRIIDLAGEKCLLSMIMDVTERKQLEDALALRRLELERLYEALLSLREEERRNVARDLHDELGHLLTALRMDVDWVDARVQRQDAQLTAKLETICKLVDKVVDSVRRIMEDLHPAMLNELGLVAALQGYVEQFSARTGVRCDLAVSDDKVHLDSRQQINLFRIVQETLNNVCKPAQPTEVKLELTGGENDIVLVVEDNRQAPELAADGAAQGLGLPAIRERVALLGGSLAAKPVPGGGFRVEAVIPHQAEVSGE